MIGRTFVELADTLVEGYDLIEFVHLLAERCVQVLGVDEAGVVLADEKGTLRILASSSERMRLLELFELQREDGPCLDAFRDGSPVKEHDLQVATDRWPTFRSAALAAGFRSVYAAPLRLRNQRIGALNLFAERPFGLADDDQVLSQALADVATIGLIHQRTLSQSDILTQQLQTALSSRIALEQAKGLVAEQAAITVDDAFQLLRGYARHHNRYIGEVAAEIIERTLNAADLRSTLPAGKTSS